MAGMYSALSSKDGRTALALGLLTALSYWPATKAGFVWDDVIITTLPAVRDWGGLWRLWFDPGGAYLHGDVGEGHYWPLTYSSFWLEHKLWGFSPVGYHVVNLLLHFVNTLLLWRLLARLGAPAPWLAAAIFAVHPLRVESVVWVIGRKDLLSSLFYFTAIMAWLRFVETGRAGRYVLSLFLFAAGLLCKSSVVTLPAALLVLHWWKDGRLERRTVLRTAPFFAAGLAISLADLSFYQGREALSLDYSMPERVLVAAQALWFYAGKLVWPAGLAVVYPHWDVNAADPRAWAYVIGALAVAALCWRLRRRVGRGPLACVAFFAITLAPVLGFINYGYMQFSFVADRYQYLAGIGLIALFAGACAAAVQRLVTAPGRAQTALAAGALPLLLLLGALTWKQSGIYRDELTFFRHIIAMNPDARRVYLNLAAELNRQGRAQEALAAARSAVEKEPGATETQTTLGLALLKLERYEEAEQHLARALEINPRNANAMQNMADLLRRQERYEDALETFRKVLEINPDSALAHAGMGYCLFRLGRYEETVASIKQALAMQPGLAESHFDLHLFLGWALNKTGRKEEAGRYLARIHGQAALSANDFLVLADSFRVQEDHEQAVEAYRRALELEPGHAAGHAGLGDALYRLQRYEEAVEIMQRALALQPDQPSAAALHYLSGESLRALGRPEQAPEHYEKALRADPQMDEAANRLAELLFAQERYREALDLYEPVAGRNPGDAGAHSNVGSALFMLGRTGEAVRKFERALSLDPAHENARANLELARLRLREEAE
ncbi:MAG: tetratricopeptide repeat protein [Gammaproteobacteria bacterium]|nr:tetratricopeptide repeat protein [Gammaproteobacteria bacterium]